MTDLEITKLCAEAAGWDAMETVWDSREVPPRIGILARVNGMPEWFDPLNQNGQAMALVKKFRISIRNDDGLWFACPDYPHAGCESDDLNRAIVECVAQMQMTTLECVAKAQSAKTAQS